MRTLFLALWLTASLGLSAQKLSSDAKKTYYVKDKESAGQVYEVVSNAKKGYYVKDSKLVNGIFIENADRLDRMTRAIIPQQRLHDATVLYPRDIDEYGFPGESRYVSCTIQRDGAFQKVFLEEFIRLNDTTVLFYYQQNRKEEFYLQTGCDIRLLTEDNFRQLGRALLGRNEGCLSEDVVEDLSPSVNYRTIEKFYTAFIRCNANVIQRMKYGVTVNIGGGILAGNEEVVPAFRYQGWGVSWSAGAFVQLPLDMYFNFRAELLFAYLDNNKGWEDASAHTDIVKTTGGRIHYHRRSLQVPLLFRYNMNQIRGRFIPYIEAGPLFDFRVGGKQKVFRQDTWTAMGVPEVPKYEESDIALFQYGAVAGAGVEYKLNRKQSLYAGVRYNFLRGENGKRSRNIESVNHLFFTLAFGF